MRFYHASRFFVVAVGAASLLVANAQAADPLKIGIVWSYANADQSILTYDLGMETYLKMHGGTAGGRTVQFIKRDDGGINPELAKRQTQELIVQENVDAVAGFIWTANALAAGPITLAAKKPQMIGIATALGYLDKFPNMTRYSMTIYELGEAMGSYASSHGIKTAYSVFINIQSGTDSAAGFEKTFTAGGGKVLGSDAIPITSRDFSAYLARIKDAKPDAIWLWMPATGGAPQFLQAFHSLGLDKLGIKILSTGDLVEENNLKAEGDSPIGVISSYNYSQVHNSALNRAFVKTFKSIAPPNVEANFGAAIGYDTMAAIAMAVQAQNGGFDYDKTMDALKGMKWESPRGPVQIDPQTRDLIQNIYIRRTEKVKGVMQNTEIATYPLMKNP